MDTLESSIFCCAICSKKPHSDSELKCLRLIRIKTQVFYRNFTLRVNNHRFKDTYYLPMLPSYLASQPGGKGWFCHGWNCVQALAIFVFTSDKNSAIVTSCDSTSNIPYDAREATPTNYLRRQNKVHIKGVCLFLSVLQLSNLRNFG